MFSIPARGRRSNQPQSAREQVERRLQMLHEIRNRIQHRVQATCTLNERAGMFIDAGEVYAMESEAWLDLARVLRGASLKGEVYVRMAQACDRMSNTFAALAYVAKLMDQAPAPSVEPFLQQSLNNLSGAYAAEIGTVAGLLRREHWSQGL